MTKVNISLVKHAQQKALECSEKVMNAILEQLIDDKKIVVDGREITLKILCKQGIDEDGEPCSAIFDAIYPCEYLDHLEISLSQTGWGLLV